MSEPTPFEKAQARFDAARSTLERTLEDIEDASDAANMSRLIAIAEMERGLCERAALALIAEHFKLAHIYLDEVTVSLVSEVLKQAHMLP